MLILSLSLLALCIFSFFVPLLDKKLASHLWQLVYVAPLILTAVLSAFTGGSFACLGFYLGAGLMILSLYAGKARNKTMISAASTLCVLVSMFVVLVLKTGTGATYLKDFEEGFTTMREHYVLTEEKDIDWNKLYAKYRPLFERADAMQDEVLNYKSWLQFTQEFHDGHVGYTAEKTKDEEKAKCEIFGRDYGLSLLRLSSGEYVAVNVEGCGEALSITDYGEDYAYAGEYLSETAEADRLTLKNAGLHNGSIITAWDGRSIEEAEKEVDVYVDSFPSLDNEEFYLPLYAAGKGGESVDISFIDDNGKEKTVTAKALGAYYPRLKSTVKLLDSGVNISNLDFQEVDAETVLLRIYQMAYDTKSYDGADYTAMSEEVRSKVLEYREKGYKRMILDLRKNGGGSPFMVGGVVQLFAPKGEHLVAYSTKINEKTASYERGSDGKYVKDQAQTYMGEDLWSHGDILLLVNYETVSAGDMMTYLMAEYPNVTILGFTGSNSSCQAVTGTYLSAGTLTFSAVPNLDEDSEPIIDTRSDRLRGVPIDHVIPLSEEAVSAIFDRGEDYVLEYAVRY
ncbi:MAG: hypothetical protein IK115_10480 [Lachnospiraceae bacterium]|nr:hypothetical protein [Lachnospiraceae bacterium]